MKRFWEAVDVVGGDGNWEIRLDGRPVLTPARAALKLPTEALAQAIASEWRSVAGELNPRAMPLTGLANAAIDRVAPDKAGFAAGVARYAEADLACYRVEGPRALVESQEKHWDALLAWARRRYDIDFCTTTGLIHVDQPAGTVERLAHAVATLDPFRMAAVSSLVTIGGSLVAALAVAENAVTGKDAWDAVSVDERWQMEQWGTDPEAEAALADRRRDFMAATGFLALLDA